MDQVRRGYTSREVLSGCGRIAIRRSRYELSQGGTGSLVDDLIDAAHESVSVAVKEMCCRLGIDSGSFQRAAGSLLRVGQLRLSDELLRKIVESEGKAALVWQDQATVPLTWNAESTTTTATEDGSPVRRMYVGMDGFMLPMVTEAEQSKRYQKAKARRKKLRRKHGVRRPRLKPSRGADQRYKEFKLVRLYDQEQKYKWLRVTRHGPDRVAKLLRLMAEDVKLFRADQITAVTDGAEWIARILADCLPEEKTTFILDYYHATEHVHKARRDIWGEASPDGEQWAKKLIGRIYEEDFAHWSQDLLATRASLRGPAKRKAIDALIGYLFSRKEKIEYAQFRFKGLKIGSGPTESSCKSEARRLKGIGMRWTQHNADGMLALEALHQSDLWQTYWKSKFKLAA